MLTVSLNCTWFTESQVEITKDLQLVLHKNEATYQDPAQRDGPSGGIAYKTDSLYDTRLPRPFYPSSSRIHLSSVLLDKAKNGFDGRIDGNIYWGWDKCDVY